MRHVKLVLFLLAALAVFFIWSFVNKAYVGGASAKPPIAFVVERGQSSEDVAAKLKEAGIIDSVWMYRLYGRVDRAYQRPKAGEYEFRPETNYKKIVATLAEGPMRRETQVRVIEGWTVNDIIDHLKQTEGVDPEISKSIMGRSVNAAAFDPSLRETYAFLKSLPADRSLEGYLFPDTYRVWADQLPDTLVEKQLVEFEQKFGGIKASALPAPLRSLDEAVILASIVQREVRHPEDMRIVAGIFLNRLRSGMRLQSDATVNYLTGSGRARSNAEDLEIDSPYNSYEYAGLPPSPVGNPGAAAIEAVLDPAETDYFFFLTDREGNTLYGRNFEEHLRNRQRAGY